MRIPINKDLPVPLYRQIEHFIAAQIESGALAPENRLPSNRQLSESLGVSRIVVANAYAELESHGLVYSRQGSGTFVAPLYAIHTSDRNDFISAQDWPLWQQELLSRSWQASCQDLDQLLSSVSHPDLISFAERLGADDIWPTHDFRRTFQNALRRKDGVTALGLKNISGHLSLRTAIAQIMASEGIPVSEKNILITSGSQQALNLVARVLLKPGDIVLVESPTYNVAIDLFRSIDVRLLGIPVDENGMQTERVEEIIRTTPPRLIYTQPTFHNPTGVCMSAGRRRQLVSLADRYNIPILEDDFIGNIRFEGRAEPALKSLDPGGRVIYAGTFSKLLMPSLRLGFLVASGPIFERLVACKYVTDLSTSDLLQHALVEYISVGRYHAHLKNVCTVYRERRDLMMKALRKYLPPETRWITPRGGGFIWVQLPDHVSGNRLFELAAEEGVTFIPGSYFYPGQRPQSNLRLNFTINPVERIEEGVRRLGLALERYMKDTHKE
jgi:GntR family transcriptional regulator / MocR family aminotransferase